MSHEAGYDAFMTGCVFARLLRLHEIAKLQRQSRWTLPTAPSCPPPVACVQPFAGRMYLGRAMDLHWCSVTGPDPVSQRPNVFYVYAQNGRLRWHDIQRRFNALKLGNVRVQVINQGKGAYVEVSNAEKVPKVMHTIRESGWNIKLMSYSDYYYAKQKAAGGAISNGSSSNGGGDNGTTATGAQRQLQSAATRQAPSFVSASPEAVATASNVDIVNIQTMTEQARAVSRQMQANSAMHVGSGANGSEQSTVYDSSSSSTRSQAAADSSLSQFDDDAVARMVGQVSDHDPVVFESQQHLGSSSNGRNSSGSPITKSAAAEGDSNSQQTVGSSNRSSGSHSSNSLPNGLQQHGNGAAPSSSSTAEQQRRQAAAEKLAAAAERLHHPQPHRPTLARPQRPS